MYRLGENLKLIYTKYLLSIFLLLYSLRILTRNEVVAMSLHFLLSFFKYVGVNVICWQLKKERDLGLLRAI